MIELGPVGYAKTPDGVRIAYTTIGEGPVDLVYISGGFMTMEMIHTPQGSAVLEHLTSFARVILFDRRGLGASDRFPDLPTLEHQVDDVIAVLDAVGAENVALYGLLSGGALATLVAATFPARCHALTMYAAQPRFLTAPDWPVGVPPGTWDGVIEAIEEGDVGPLIQVVAPTRVGDPGFEEVLSRMFRLGAGPSGASAMMRILGQLDVRPILPTVSVPTLVIQPQGDGLYDPLNGRYFAEQIPGARLVEVPWPDFLRSDIGSVEGAIEEFLTGVRRAPESDRALATVLFTDIVDSTARAADMGDAVWKALLDRHDLLAAEIVDTFRGRLVKTTGDGVLATFDGPARAVEAALRLRTGCRGLGLDIRSGLHVGEVESRGDDVGGIAVHIASRVQGMAAPSEILVTRTVKDLVYGSGLEFDDRGTHELKGVPEPWQVLAVRD